MTTNKKTMNDIFRDEVRKFFLDHYTIDHTGSDIWHYDYVKKVIHHHKDPCQWKKLRLILSWLVPSAKRYNKSQEKWSNIYFYVTNETIMMSF